MERRIAEDFIESLTFVIFNETIKFNDFKEEWKDEEIFCMTVKSICDGWLLRPHNELQNVLKWITERFLSEIYEDILINSAIKNGVDPRDDSEWKVYIWDIDWQAKTTDIIFDKINLNVK